MMIDKQKPVLVTGANGYVASWLVKKLLEKGITVHAAVRNPKDDNKVGHLKDLAKNNPGTLHLFKADLLQKGSYTKAMEACELVFHTASPFITDVKDPKKDLIDPAEKGTANVLESANELGTVKKIVLTSSCAAMYTDSIDTKNTPNGFLTEEVWNHTASLDYQPYFYSKTLAEKKAWEIAKKQNVWELVTINPSLVMGPPLNPNYTTSESMSILKQIGKGDFKMGAPKIGIGLVDVRDVADAHFEAGFNAQAKGRYITSGYNTDLLEIGMSLQDKFGDQYALPKKALPKWLLMIIGPMTNKLFTRKFIRNNVNVAWKADNSKIKKELGITFRPFKETMEESFQTMIDHGII
ncbi:MAG: NAD-dependent epimerase/dehydratase family protein [Flavobacteriales bacterium]|jgi:nucleoside-diphosphate-sugar epimerase|nr:NAD-dependent epimerase/dehydratase family protein [Flavobacteriales bacterium]